MEWAKPKQISKEKLNKAGDVLIDDKSSEEQKKAAIEILDNWRAIHSYPMHVFKMRLKNTAKTIDENALIAQRLKRVPAIINKLKRKYNGRPATMKLSQMQDIGGCRAVLANVCQVKKLFEGFYLKGELKHKRVGIKDYIANPKKDGYRSIHIIYKYRSDKEGKKEYNGLLVEIQIRSKLQHLWATAIETVDLFTRQAIKSNEGQKEWADFFKLVSSAFAKMEKCPIVPDTPADEKVLYALIKQKEAELKVMKVMSGWTHAMKIFGELAKGESKAQYFLLELDIPGGKMNLASYTKEEEKKAISDYARAEKRHEGDRDYDVVLVGVDTISELRKAYPNYFVDSGEFLQNLQKVIAQ